MADPLSHLMDLASIPFHHFHTVQQHVILMVPVYEGHSSRKELLQRLHFINVILIPDVSGISRDYENVRFPHFPFLVKTKERNERAVLIFP